MVSLLEQYETQSQQTDSFAAESNDLNNPVIQKSKLLTFI